MRDHAAPTANDTATRREALLSDAGRLVLRVAIAGLMLFHGVHKVLHGIDGIRADVIAKGAPAVLAYGVYVGEVVAPALVLVGWMSRPAGLVLAFNMIVAIGLVHGEDVCRLGRAGQWAIELQLLFLLGGVAVALLGPGRWSLSARLSGGRNRLG